MREKVLEKVPRATHPSFFNANDLLATRRLRCMCSSTRGCGGMSTFRPPDGRRRLSGPEIHMHCCKALQGIKFPPSTHQRRRFQLIRQRAFHTRRVKRAHEFAVWRTGFRFPFSGFRFPVSVSGFRYPIPPLQS